MTMFTLTVRAIADPEYREVISARPDRADVERTERYVLAKLNYDDFYTYIEESDDG